MLLLQSTARRPVYIKSFLFNRKSEIQRGELWSVWEIVKKDQAIFKQTVPYAYTTE